MTCTKELLEDIKSYKISKNIISEIYYDKNKDLLQFEKNADKYWLYSDLNLFAKLNINSNFDLNFNVGFYKLAIRYYMLNSGNTKKIKNYKNILDNKININSSINLLLGLLTSNERNYFIKIRNYISYKII
jgi:hypothetical protein